MTITSTSRMIDYGTPFRYHTDYKSRCVADDIIDEKVCNVRVLTSARDGTMPSRMIIRNVVDFIHLTTHEIL